MRNIKIGTRLGLGFGLVIILLLIMSAIGLWRMVDTTSANAQLNERQSINSLVLQWAREIQVNTNLTLVATNYEDPDAQRRANKQLLVSDEELRSLKDQLSTRLDDDAAIRIFQQASEAQDKFFQDRQTAFNHLERWEIVQSNAFFSNEMPRQVDHLVGLIDELSAMQGEQIRQVFEDSNNDNQLGIIILLVATILALIISPLLAWLVTRSITRPLQHAMELANAVARRDLSQNIRIFGRDEVAELERSLQMMSQGLRNAVGEVRSGAMSIASASGQITTGNLDLSSRTEEQASSLAETAATMEEITATVRQNADNVKQANVLASSAARTATEGGSIVTELVGTMGEINAKSRQVSDIIGVIDSIAFQTNILALNAAVEAARAGEQGRGFAVVASEVRALAQRSAAAAREIKELIDTSVAATDKGNEQASRAGETVQEIVEGINRVTDIMGEINAANQEQTTGIEEINAAIMQMDDVTRQNASLVEQSAAAAGSLQEQADALARLVATFTLDRSEAAEQQARLSMTGGNEGAAHKDAAASTTAKPAAPEIARAPDKRIASTPVRKPVPRKPAVEKTKEAAAASAPKMPEKPALASPQRPVRQEHEEWIEF